MNFVMLVGIPGCGKSTFAKTFETQGYKIHSPDKIKNELNMHSVEEIKDVFNIVETNILKDMESNYDIVYDSTNLPRKRRIQFLDRIKKYNYKTICYVFIVPIDVCKQRNLKRTGYSFITDAEYKILLNIFNPPLSDEGWDKIIYKVYDGKTEFLKEKLV